MPKPFNRPHSQAAAAIMTKVNKAKGWVAEASRAGSKSASKMTAVMMRCLSMMALDRHDFLLFG
jgi:hypothetical protein